MNKYGEPSSHHYLNPDEFVSNVPRPMAAHDLPAYAQPQVYESGTHHLNSLQRQLDKHPGG